MQTKGLEFGGYEPRGLKATGYGFATSNIGGSHGNGALAFQEWGSPVPRPVDRFDDDNKADIVIYNQNGSALGEISGVCVFSRQWGDWYSRLFPKMLVAATGIEELGDMQYLSRVGERIVNLDRSFNARDGFDRRYDTLPQRLLTEPLETGTAEGQGQIVRGLERFLDEYYQLRGWTNTGIPTPEKLRSLGLNDAADDMERLLANNN
jgi:aldehyde:ferredoxin oxidoreductase